MDIAYPLHFDGRGKTAVTDPDSHIRGMLEQLLLTSQGERVNRPDFGSGLLQMVFAPASNELATALKFTIQGAIQRWLGDVIEVKSLEVTSEDGSLTVFVQYVVRQSGEARSDTFQFGGAA